jgi:hypothetical protein
LVEGQADIERFEAGAQHLLGAQAPGIFAPAVPALDRMLLVDDDDAAVHRAQHRFQIEAIARRLLGLDAQLLVDRLHFLVGGASLLVEGLQLLVGGLELLVGGLQLLVGRLELLVGGLQLLVRGLELLDRISRFSCAASSSRWSACVRV